MSMALFVEHLNQMIVFFLCKCLPSSKKLIKMILKLPRIARKFYIVFGILFLFWMIFIDSNDFYTQFKLNNQLNTLEAEKEFYHNKIEEVKQEREQLLTDKDELEKFARENYLMKRESEDLFIIVKE